MSVIAKTPLSLLNHAFKSFGRVVEPHAEIPSKWGAGWKCFSGIDRLITNAPLMVGLVFCDGMPAIIDSLEAHTSREELLWATGDDLFMAVAEPADLDNPHRRPEVDKCEIFRIKAGQAVIIERGVWHSPAFSATGKPAHYFFLVEDKPDSIDQDAKPWIAFADNHVIRLDQRE